MIQAPWITESWQTEHKSYEYYKVWINYAAWIAYVSLFQMHVAKNSFKIITQVIVCYLFYQWSDTKWITTIKWVSAQFVTLPTRSPKRILLPGVPRGNRKGPEFRSEAKESFIFWSKNRKVQACTLEHTLSWKIMDRAAL